MNKKQVYNKNETISLWVKEYLDELINYTYFKTSDQIAAENIVQDTFEAVIKGFDNFEQKSSPKTWIYGILKNKIRDFYKSKNISNKFINLDFSDSDGDEDILDKFFDENGKWKNNQKPQTWHFEEEQNLLDNHDFQKIMIECIEYLPDKWKECIKLKYLVQSKGKEICNILEINQTNYWQMLHRAKLQLRDCLDNNWFKKYEE